MMLFNSAQKIAPKHALLIVFLVGGLSLLRCANFISTWHLTHWAFTYEHGFIKRGLVGDLTWRAFGAVTPITINYLGWSVFGILAITLAFWFTRPAWKHNRLGTWLFAIIAITHSATIPHFEYDLGRD